MISLKWLSLWTNFSWMVDAWGASKATGFFYSACGPLTKHCERIQKFKETVNLKHIYKNDLDRACFAPDTAYSDSKDLAKSTVSNKILKERAYKIAITQRRLASMVYKFFDKKAD